MNVSGVSISRVIDCVERVVATMLRMLDGHGEHRPGGYFALADDATGRIITVTEIGPEEIMPEKAEKYFAFAQEKAVRLSRHVQTNSPSAHQSSWQSRNESANQYGGAIVTRNYWILSFSGLPELADEAVMLLAAVELGWMEYSQAVEIAKISNNQYFVPLYHEWIQTVVQSG